MENKYKVMNLDNNNSLFKEDDGKEEIVNINIKDLRLHEGDKFHKNEKKIDELASSIKQLGQLTPIIVVKDDIMDHMYKIVAGKHRYYALRKLGYSSCSCIIKNPKDKEEMNGIIAHSNKQRENISTMEKAYMIKYDYELIKKKQGEGEGLSMDKVAALYDLSLSKVKRLYKLTFLIKEFQDEVDKKKLGEVAAENLARLSEEEQRKLFEIILEEGIKIKSIDLELTDMIRQCFKDFTEKDLRMVLNSYTDKSKKIKGSIYKDKDVFIKGISKKEKENLIEDYIYMNLKDFKEFINRR